MLATNNPGKIKEMAALLAAPHRRFLTLREAGVMGEADETGNGFSENAMLKAKFAVQQCHLPCIADDSGLEVEALDWAPGIFSARYAPPGSRKKTLLSRMEGQKNRSARFVCSAVCAFPDGQTLSAAGICNGEITHALIGEGGFGYDPIFYMPALGKTFAQLSEEEKNRVSHRGAAFAELSEMLRTKEQDGEEKTYAYK